MSARPLPRAIICDIDGTIADLTHRLHFIINSDGEKLALPDWTGFFSAVSDDKPIEPIIKLVDILSHKHAVLLVSGRNETSRADTEAWLERHNIYFDQLYMRPEHNFRADYEIKEMLYSKYIEGVYDVRYVLEDREKPVKHWRDLGLTCLQVADGKF